MSKWLEQYEKEINFGLTYEEWLEKKLDEKDETIHKVQTSVLKLYEVIDERDKEIESLKENLGKVISTFEYTFDDEYISVKDLEELKKVAEEKPDFKSKLPDLNCPKDKCAYWDTISPNECYRNCARNLFNHDKPKDLCKLIIYEKTGNWNGNK